MTRKRPVDMGDGKYKIIYEDLCKKCRPSTTNYDDEQLGLFILPEHEEEI